MAEGTPIVLIHGIRGSQLVQTYDDSFDVVYSAVQQGFETIHDLTLDDTGRVERDPFDLIQVQRVENAAYGELLGRLRRTFEGVPVYVFRYDWRLDLARTARAFDHFLRHLTRKTGSSSFRLVTHSMGALVVSAFLARAERNRRRIDRTVLAAPPFTGAVEAVRGLVIGDARRFGIHASDVYRKIARSFPSAYQMLPSYDGAWHHPRARASIWNLKHWQHRVEFGDRDRDAYRQRDALMKRHLERARDFVQSELLDFDALPEADRARFLVLYGRGEPTRTRIRVHETNRSGEIRYFFDFDGRGTRGDGDGTVPAASAEHFAKLPRIAVPLDIFSAWWPTVWDDRLKLRIAGFHPMFLGLDKVQGVVVDWLAGRDPAADWVEPIRR